MDISQLSMVDILVAENEQNKLNKEWLDFVPTDENINATISDTTHGLENYETALNKLEGSEVQTVSQLQEHTPVGEDYLQMVNTKEEIAELLLEKIQAYHS